MVVGGVPVSGGRWFQGNTYKYNGPMVLDGRHAINLDKGGCVVPPIGFGGRRGGRKRAPRNTMQNL